MKCVQCGKGTGVPNQTMALESFCGIIYTPSVLPLKLHTNKTHLSFFTVPKRVPIIGTGSLQGPFWRFGSLSIFQGPYFQCFDYIYAENINSVCMNTTMSLHGLSVMSNFLHVIVHIVVPGYTADKF